MPQLSNEDLANIAHDYYLSKLNIADISQKYNLSRYLIAKALEDAEKSGIVKINIYHGTRRNGELERIFQDEFGLKEAIILNNLDTASQDNDALVEQASKQIQSYIKNSHNVGMTWGALMHDIINHFNNDEREDLNFIQILGQAIRSDKQKNQLVQLAADKFAAESKFLPAPLYVVNPDYIKVMKQEPFYQSLEADFHDLDLIFASVGTMESLRVNSFIEKYYWNTLFKDIDDSKLVGTLFGRPYDIEGNIIDGIDQYICGISMEDIMNTPTRFLVVKNRFKAKALVGALRTGTITHLVTNEAIAQKALKIAQEN
ncbi:ArsR family transcriptional regulator [Lactobacillus pasteurii DSM 23907 = CRBIP 24.76]|uniref:Transcriptional regulator n=1 Tax=Lactobacillus pasteurii DSM 23907 = CRBIP 24.76 TaxID=1423790 RepID=I7JYK4_9LACO|nr:sugar-binding domain-containing protein [Lactobacillus pasteurii]KRK08512.1 ArsR family transcriptional regulator [Lactobacillus pasteurii DSM 23907 = CRBIP 24.76]TDG75691.1 hypothetical protein C5L33_000576 [Lactobacillus pasteurii]CCI85625.1 Transcriptional regulator [Lactobacillus pasteurii DSM 23907 = CRBIP 24.76]